LDKGEILKEFVLWVGSVAMTGWAKTFDFWSIRGFLTYTLTMRFLLFVITTFFLLGCLDTSDDHASPSVEPIRATLMTAIPLAHAAHVAMRSIQGSPPPGVQVSNTCVSYPCQAFVTFTQDSQDLPVAVSEVLGETGSVVVAGSWGSADSAVLFVSYIDMHAGSSWFPVSSISFVPVQYRNGQLIAVHMGMDINIETGPVYSANVSDQQYNDAMMQLEEGVSEDPYVSVKQDVRVVQVDDAGTPGDFSDDIYTVHGGSQYISAGGSATIYQLGMGLTRVSRNCLLNPTEGLAVFQNVAVDNESLPELGQAIFLFKEACTGNVEVTLGTGDYFRATGEQIPLNLQTP
jgi:hypothetical protein